MGEPQAGGTSCFRKRGLPVVGRLESTVGSKYMYQNAEREVEVFGSKFVAAVGMRRSGVASTADADQVSSRGRVTGFISRRSRSGSPMCNEDEGHGAWTVAGQLAM